MMAKYTVFFSKLLQKVSMNQLNECVGCKGQQLPIRMFSITQKSVHSSIIILSLANIRPSFIHSLLIHFNLACLFQFQFPFLHSFYPKYSKMLLIPSTTNSSGQLTTNYLAKKREQFVVVLMNKLTVILALSLFLTFQFFLYIAWTFYNLHIPVSRVLARSTGFAFFSLCFLVIIALGVALAFAILDSFRCQSLLAQKEEVKKDEIENI